MRQVDADALIETIRKWYWDNAIQSAAGNPWVVDDMIDLAIRTIKGAPTVKEETTRYGRWVYDDEVGIWKCSLCNRAAISSGYGQELSEHCPRCGAKMCRG